MTGMDVIIYLLLIGGVVNIYLKKTGKTFKEMIDDIVALFKQKE